VVDNVLVAADDKVASALEKSAWAPKFEFLKKAMAAEAEASAAVGPARCCLPRHRHTF